MKALSAALFSFLLVLGCGGSQTAEEVTPSTTEAVFKFDKATYAYKVTNRDPASIKFSFKPGSVRFLTNPVRVNLFKETYRGQAPVDFTANVQHDAQGDFILFDGPNLSTVEVATFQVTDDGWLKEGYGQMLATVTFINASGSPEDEATGAEVIVEQ